MASPGVLRTDDDDFLSDDSLAPMSSSAVTAKEIPQAVPPGVDGSPELHVDSREAARREFLGSTTFSTFFATAVFMVSFGVVIDNTAKGGEPKAGTAMIALGILLLSAVSAIFFRANWPIQHRPALIIILFAAILFIFISVWLAVRIWVRF